MGIPPQEIGDHMVLRRIQTRIAGLALVLALGVVFTPNAAKADATLLACRVQSSVPTPSLRVIYGSTPEYNQYYYSTDFRWVPSSSSCNDINVSYMTENYSPYPAACRFMRVVLYPSSGGALIFGSWIYHCSSASLKVLMYGVLNNTKYEIHQAVPNA